MATGQNNNRNPNRQPNRQPIKQPQKHRKKQQVPGAVIMIYVLTILLILSICALIFVITLNKTGWEGSNPGEAESLEISISSDQSNSDNSNNSDENSSDVSSGESSAPDVTSSVLFDPPSQPDNSTPSNSGSGNMVTLPANYDAEFFKDDLFIGDSIFTGLYLYGFIDQSQVAAAVGYTPYNAMHSAFNKAQYSGSATDYAAERKPKRIFIMLGSNVMGAGTNFDIIVTQYETMLQSLKQNCPNSEICVISIPPVTVDSSLAASSKINNPDIVSVNGKLQKMAQRVGAGYLDLNGMLSDDSGYFMKQYAEADGLHFKGNTYRVLLSALQTKYDT